MCIPCGRSFSNILKNLTFAIKWASTWQNLSSGLAKKWHSNQSPQLQIPAKKWIFAPSKSRYNTFQKWITKVLIRLCTCTGWSVPLLFTNPKNRFSPVEAHIDEAHIIYYLNPYKPSVLFVGHQQTVQNQIRCRKMLRLIWFSTFCKQKFLLKFE